MLDTSQLKIQSDKYFSTLFFFQIWSVSIPTLLLSLTAEHARSNFFKNIGPGVTQLHIDSHSRLFSCGADGSMKVRQLPDRETLFNNHHH